MRPPAGLCDSCRHQRLVGTTRGSEFSLCLRSRVEPESYPRYPRVPVRECRGFEPSGRTASDGVAPEDPGRPAATGPPPRGSGGPGSRRP